MMKLCERMESAIPMRSWDDGQEIIVKNIAVGLIAKETYSHVTQPQENAKHFSATAGGFAHFKRWYSKLLLKVQVWQVLQIVGWRTIFKNLINTIQDKAYIEEWIFKADVSTLFIRNLANKSKWPDSVLNVKNVVITGWQEPTLFPLRGLLWY